MLHFGDENNLEKKTTKKNWKNGKSFSTSTAPGRYLALKWTELKDLFFSFSVGGSEGVEFLL